MNDKEQKTVRFIQKTIAELENSAKAERARANVDKNKNSVNDAFVYDTNSKNFVVNHLSASLIPASQRVNVVNVPYDVRGLRKLINSGYFKVPHAPSIDLPTNVIAEVDRRTGFSKKFAPLTKEEILAQLPSSPYIHCENNKKIYLPSSDLPADYEFCVADHPTTAYGRNARIWTCGLLRSLAIPETKAIRVYYLVLYGNLDVPQMFQEGRDGFSRSALRCISLRRVTSMPNSNFMNDNQRNAAAARGDLVEATLHHQRGATTVMPLDISLGSDNDDVNTWHHIVGHDPVIVVFAKPVPIVKSHRLNNI
jgi:hypothetical protein